MWALLPKRFGYLLSRCTRPKRKVHTIAVFTLIVCISSLLSCSRQHDPQAAYDRAWKAFQQGDLSRAQREANDGYEFFHTFSAEWAWKFNILRARILFDQSLYGEVLTLLSSERSEPSGELIVQKYRFEGMAYSALHRFTDAVQKFAEADRVCADSDYAPCADVINARGMLEMARGHYAEARTLFERVLTSARKSGDRVWEAETLLNLSWAADEQTHYDEALNWADAARKIAIVESVPGITQKAFGDMGWAYYKLGDLDKAKEIFTEARREAQEIGLTSDEVKWLTNLGYIDMDAGDLSKALKSFQQSLDRARKIQSREDIINSLIALAFASEADGELEEASRLADEALRMAREDGNKRDETYPRLVQARVAARQRDPSTAEAAFHEVEISPASPVFLKWEAEHGLARLYEDENQPTKAAGEYPTALNTFESARSELQHENSRLPFLTNATRIYDDYIHFLIAQGKTNEALQVADYSRARTLGEGLSLLKTSGSFRPDPLNAAEIARRSNGTVLFYWLGNKQSYLWAVTPQRTSLFTLPPASEIEAEVQHYRAALTGPQDPVAILNSYGVALYKMLVAPAQAVLTKNARVFIIPDGCLNSLNFETLLVPDPTPHYWIEDVTVTDASSLRMLAASHRSTKAKDSLLLFGNAVAANSDYPELRKAAEEIESIGKHFSPAHAEVVVREKATPPAYLESNPEQYSYIHFVAHGTASRMSPLDSAIVLSRANAQDDSFKLYARDIIQHPLRADLVTISTCYGAGFRAYSGEGLVGLSWAFLRAGAHNVIGALWEVSDVSTPQLMDQLYRGIKEGQRPDAALRAAKLSLLHSGTAFRKPFYWAPFQLYTGS